MPALDNILLNPNHTTAEINEWRSYDFVYECVENPTRNRITGRSSYLSIDTETRGSSPGRWVLINRTHHNNTNATTTTRQPWFTRYQPQNGCSSWEDPKCKGPTTDNSRIHDYEFQWADGNDWVQNITHFQLDLGIRTPTEDYILGKDHNGQSEFDQVFEKYTKKEKEPNEVYEDERFYAPNKVCLVGDSHSGKQLKALYRLNLGHLFGLATSTYPDINKMTTDFFKEFYFKRNCTRFVINIGQWSLHHGAPGGHPYSAHGKQKGHPYSTQQFHDDLKNIVINEDIYTIGNKDIKIYLQNMHHDPLSYMMSGCTNEGKAIDWRAPTEIDCYIHAVKEIVDEM